VIFSASDIGGGASAPAGVRGMKLRPSITTPRKQSAPPLPAAPGKSFNTPASKSRIPTTSTPIATRRFMGSSPLLEVLG
jgi:hypothetical protein